MKITVAIDSFKGSLSGEIACETVKEALEKDNNSVEVFPVGDGGEGTAAVLARCEGAYPVEIETKGIYSPTVKGRYYIKDKRAIIECAEFVGIDKSKVRKDALLYFDTQGYGQAVMHAVEGGATDIVLCLGGSGTNDGGAGFLYSLGVRFYDSEGRGLSPVPFALKTLARVDLSGLDKRLKKCRFTVLCDVDNPLTGEYGCSRVFAPQKGASEECVEISDAIIADYAGLLETAAGRKCSDEAGSGAAGGLGFAAKCVLGAECVSGIKYVMEKIGLERSVKECDAVVSGEGKIDCQTLRGKVIKGIADFCEKYDKPLYLIAGKAEVSAEQLGDCVKAVVSLCRDGLSEKYCMDNARQLLYERAEKLGKIIRSKVDQ